MANSLKAYAPPVILTENKEETEEAKEMDDTVGEPEEEEEEDDEEERKARAAAEEAAARERAAQRQLMAIEELVHTERNFLKNLQICTVTIHSNLRKLQVLAYALLHKKPGCKMMGLPQHSVLYRLEAVTFHATPANN